MPSHPSDDSLSDKDVLSNIQEPTTPTHMAFHSDSLKTPVRGVRPIIDGVEMSRLSVSPEKRKADADLLPSAAPPPAVSNSSCFSDFVSSTPHRPSSQSLRLGIPLTDERKILKDELGDHTQASEEHIHALYTDLLPDDVIDAFLKETDLYDDVNAEWSALLAMAGQAEKLVYAEQLRIFDVTIKKFVDPTGVEREVMKNDNKKLKGIEIRHTSPDFVVRGSGSSFQSGKGDPHGVRYSSLVAWFDGERDDKMKHLSEHLGQANIYARQLLAHQPNRIWVRCMVVSERHVRVIHYDRAGHEVSPLINIHQHPRTFVRLIVGLTSKSESVIGLDDTVQWTIDADGRKEAGTVTIPGLDDTSKVYDMVEVDPIVHRYTIRGRGTVCWRVKDPETSDMLLIKDSWRSEDRTPEHTLLDLVKEFKGVGRIVGGEYRIGETVDFRCETTRGWFYNRVGSRIVMEAHGKTIDHFKSALQFLLALFDAIDAHRKLYTTAKSQILHRDVFILNVLLGKEDAEVGDRGILIDLDMTIKCDLPDTFESSDPRSASNFWRSLKSLEMVDNPPAHDYLDDLESFFYLLLFILVCFYHDGHRQPTHVLSTFLDWEHEDLKKAFNQKLGTLTARSNQVQNETAVQTAWGDTCAKLLIDYRNWVLKIYKKKSELLLDEPAMAADGTEKNRLESLLTPEAAAANYKEVLSFITVAIEGIKKTPPPAVPAEAHRSKSKRDKRRAAAAAQADAKVPIAQRPKRARTGKQRAVADAPNEPEGSAS